MTTTRRRVSPTGFALLIVATWILAVLAVDGVGQTTTDPSRIVSDLTRQGYDCSQWQETENGDAQLCAGGGKLVTVTTLSPQ